MRLTRKMPLWRPVSNLQQRKVLPVFGVLFLITSTYFQLKHPYKPVFISLVNSVDELPPAVRALLTIDNKKASDEINKVFPSVFKETLITAMMVCFCYNSHNVANERPVMPAINAPDKPCLLQFSPPPEV